MSASLPPSPGGTRASGTAAAAAAAGAASSLKTRMLSWWVNTVHALGQTHFHRSRRVWVLGCSYGLSRPSLLAPASGTLLAPEPAQPEQQQHNAAAAAVTTPLATTGHRRASRSLGRSSSACNSSGRRHHSRGSLAQLGGVDDSDGSERHRARHADTVSEGDVDIDTDTDDVPYRAALAKDIGSRFWITYRREFPPLPGGGATTDVGWGCMLRSAQMMLAQALVLHCAGRDWRRADTTDALEFEFRLLSLFEDTPEPSSPFSVHHMLAFTSVNSGQRCGDYQGPTSVARALETLINDNVTLAQKVLRAQEPLLAYMAFDSLIDRSEIERIVVSRENVAFCPMLLLLPVRLGLKSISDSYWQRIELLYHRENFLGIMGGRAQHSLYFIGRQGDKLCGLDPHCCYRTATNKLRLRDVSALEHYHTKAPRLVGYSDVDPSLAVGFYCPTRALLDEAIHLATSSDIPGQPLLSVAEFKQAHPDPRLSFL